MIKRRRLSRLQRATIFEDAQGLCCICHLSIHAGRGERWIVEHVKPLWLGGEDEFTNMLPAHERCAIAKTVSEAPVKAKTDRQRASHLGIKRRQSRPMIGSRASGWKRKMSGELVRR